jgi:hypothetical protein
MKWTVVLILMFLVPSLSAKENWRLSVTVLSTQNIEDPHGTFHLSWFSSNAGWSQSSGGAGWAHRITEHAFIEADNGNSYELQPKNPKDILLPGAYKAKIEKRDMEICEPKDNGNCREVKFFVIAATTTVQAEKSANKTNDPATQASVAIDSTPSNADIEVDGAFVGNTPSTVPLAAGSHQIVVKKKGFVEWNRTIAVNGGAIHLNAELEQVETK